MLSQREITFTKQLILLKQVYDRNHKIIFH